MTWPGLLQELARQQPFHLIEPLPSAPGWFDRGQLALTREIIEAHGGRIRLVNRDGGGLSVMLSLPPPPAATA